MTTHVFIVNARSFPIHLKYLFAGTTAGDSRASWTPLLADIKRVRPRDEVIFYVNLVGFYGTFRVAQATPLVLHESAEPGYLRDELGVRLIYRTLLEPATVYPHGVSEWDALEKLPVYAKEVIWSLIYRKLKGERGCTPIFPHEASRLMNMIKDANPDGPLAASKAKGLTWDSNTERITLAEPATYKGALTPPPNVLGELVKRANKAHEAYLEAYFAEQAGIDPKLWPICGEPEKLKWLGNQVFCGVGMQKIDIFTILADERNNKEFRIIELKDEPIQGGIYKQLLRYINWTRCYIPDAINSNVQPIVVSRRINGIETTDAIADLRALNKMNESKVVRWFEYWLEKNTLVFEEVYY